MKKLRSLTIFFPFLNDEGTVERQINAAYKVGKMVTNDLEVIAIHGGASKDHTFEKIKEMKKIFPNLKIIDKTDNCQGYAVIKYGFTSATKEWIFYTDGDAQYHIEQDLQKLINKAEKTKADIVNGYKTKRNDNILRVWLGNCYAKLCKIFFQIPIRDIDCDFRLIKKVFLERIILESTDSSILPELIKKLELAGAKLSEIEVSHYKREYGKSNYFFLKLFWEKLTGDLKLYFKLRRIKTRNER